MPSSLNLDNGVERFNIHLDAQGNLQLNANGVNGAGSTRLQVFDENGQIRIGGSGQFGTLQFVSPSDDNTIFIGAGGSEATAIFGGGNSGLSGVLQLGSSQGLITIDMQGSVGNLVLGANPSGSTPGQDGDLLVRDGVGGTSIQMQGSNGNIRAVSVTETSDLRFKKDIAPLSNALDTILAMRGVRYFLKQEASSPRAFSEKSQIGFVGQEMETVCPEVVSTDSDGYKSLNYSRLTPILVEAVKEQQRLITQQALALKEALAKIDQLEEKMQVQGA
jgi:hypothetical protein